MGTVHVHLSVADVVEPGPCKDSISILNLLGDLEGQALVNAIGAVGSSGAGCGCIKISWSIGRATAEVAVDDLPVGGILERGCVSLIGDRDLTRTTTVNSSVGTATEIELQWLRRTGGHASFRASRNGIVTWEIVAIGIERVLDSRSGDGCRDVDQEMSIRDAEERGRNGGSNGTCIHGWRECDVEIE